MLIDVFVSPFYYLLSTLFNVQLVPARVMQPSPPFSLQINFSWLLSCSFLFAGRVSFTKKIGHNSVLLLSPNLVVLCSLHKICACVFVGKQIKGGMRRGKKKKFLICAAGVIMVCVMPFFFLVHGWWWLQCDFTSSMLSAVLGGPQRGVIMSIVVP